MWPGHNLQKCGQFVTVISAFTPSVFGSVKTNSSPFFQLVRFVWAGGYHHNLDIITIAISVNYSK